MALGCTASLKSAATVGAQGAQLSDRQPSASTDVLCDLGLALLPTSDRKACEKWSEQVEGRRAALEVLANYGVALQALAEVEDPDTAERVDGMFDALDAAELTSETDLSDDQKGALKEAIGGLVGFVSKSHRVSVITKSVKQADAPIQALVEKLVAIFQARDEYLKGLDAAFEGLLEAPPSSGSDARFVECRARPAAGASSEPCPYEAMVLVNSTDRVSLALARDLVRSAERDNDKTVRDLKAFAKVHGKLRQEIDRLEGEDAELAGELLNELRAVYAIAELKEPKAAEPKDEKK
jgi:hypothetical protein